MNEAQLRGLVASKCECLDKTKCPCGISQMKSKVQSDLHGLNQIKIGEKNQLTEKPKEEPANQAKKLMKKKQKKPKQSKPALN